MDPQIPVSSRSGGAELTPPRVTNRLPCDMRRSIANTSESGRTRERTRGVVVWSSFPRIFDFGLSLSRPVPDPEVGTRRTSGAEFGHRKAASSAFGEPGARLHLSLLKVSQPLLSSCARYKRGKLEEVRREGAKVKRMTTQPPPLFSPFCTCPLTVASLGQANCRCISSNRIRWTI